MNRPNERECDMKCAHYPRPHKRLIDERIARNDAIDFEWRNLLIDPDSLQYLIPLDSNSNDSYDPTPLDLLTLLELRLLLIDAEIEYDTPIHPYRPHTHDDAYLAPTFRFAQTEMMTEYRLSDSLCPLHHIDYAACFDDDDPECAPIRLIHPSHDT